MKSKRFSASKGFTLVEVLVALGVFAIMSSGYLVAVQKASRQMSNIEERTMALWLAENRLAQLHATNEPIESQSGQQNYEFSERAWSVATRFEPTAQAEMVKGVVSVSLQDNEEVVITSLEAFFHKPVAGSL